MNAYAIVFDYPIPESSYVPGSYNNRAFYYDLIHLGEDILLSEKTPIRAIADGKIVQYEYHSGYATTNDGTSIVAVVEHILDSTITFQLKVGDTKTVTVNKVCSIYGHIRKSEEYDGAKLTWEIGQEIKKGEIIGYVNDDAHNGDGSEHLHMGIRLGGHPNYWVYYGYENDSIAESSVLNFASASEIIDNLRCSETPQDHSLARIGGQGTTYWIQNGIMYYISSPNIFSDMVGIPGWGHICDFPAEALSLFQNGIDGNGTDFIGTSSTSEKILIKLINDPKVYRIENGERRWITTLDAFNSLGLDEDDIIIVSQEIIDLFPEGAGIFLGPADINLRVHDFIRTPDPIFADPSSDIFNPNFEANIEIRNDGSSYITIGRMYLEIYNASTGAKLWDMADPISGEPKYVENLTLMPDETFNFGRVVSFFREPGLFRLTARAEIDGQSGELASMNFQVFSKGNIITASQNGALFSMDLPNKVTTYIGEIGISGITDIAYENSRFYGITFTQLISIDLTSKVGSVVGDAGFDDMNALAISANGIIYTATTDGEFISIDPTTAKGTLIGFFGTDLTSGGDMAFHDDGILYASVNRRGYINYWLATVDISTGYATLIGDIGFNNVYGLSFSDGLLYGATSSGQVLAINLMTGEGTLLFQNNIQHWGMTTINDSTIEPDVDNDNDGYTEEQGDCDDNDPLINPGAEDICDDGIDQNCDGTDPDCAPDVDAGGGNGGGGGGCFIGSFFK